MLINFRKRLEWHYSFCALGKEEMHKYVATIEYEVSMVVHMGRIANQRKVAK